MLVQNIGVQVKKVEVLVEKIKSDDLEDLLCDATISDYFANSCEKQVFSECDVEFLEKTSQEVPMFRKRKALDDSCLSQLKRRRLSTIAENADEFSLEGEPVYEFVAEYDESSKMFIQEGRKIDLTSLIGNLSNQKEMPLDKEESMFTFDSKDKSLEKLSSSEFFLKHKSLVRSCASGAEKKFNKTDPNIPKGFRVREMLVGDGKRVDREFLNQEGTLIFRSRKAMFEYVKVLNGDSS